MAARGYAAPPTPWSRTLAEPEIHETAYVHSFSNLIGDVRIGANVMIAPGTSIRADEGAPFRIGDSTNVQDGVVIHGLQQGRVLGDDGNSYSVWIGNSTSITHMALIHGPAYVGDNCFIGFRSTVFNARIGNGCIVMMHVLIQDVEIPPGKYVPSGSVITTQQQADQLPDVDAADRNFASHVVGVNNALRSGYHCAEDIACIAPIQKETTTEKGLSDMSNGSYSNTAGSLDATIVNHVRQLLAQGYRIGTEHADDRRFQTSSWRSCAPIQATREAEVLSALDACLAEHAGEYVRLIGIDAKAKKRVLETIIQRPGNQPVKLPVASGGSGYRSPAAPTNGSVAASGLTPDAVNQVRQWLNMGCRIGTEHADDRRFQTSSWTSCSPIQSSREADVIAALQTCLAEHAGEYVRMFGIDSKAKRRVGELIIQRSAKKGGTVVAQPAGYTATVTPRPTGTVGSSAPLGGDLAQQIGQLLAQGATLALEYSDERRFRTSSWQSAPAIQARGQSDAIAAVEAFVQAHPREYVRLVGVDPKAKRRMVEVIVHRPNGKTSGTAAPVATSHAGATSYAAPPASAVNGSRNGKVDNNLMDQVRQLLARSYRIGVEYADERRYRTSSWQSGASIQANRESDVVSTLEAFLQDHPTDYVRLIGIDPKAKRRVVETVIQKPVKK